MTNLYKELKRKHEKELNNFPKFFAFDNEQFKNGMENLGLKESDTDKIYSMGYGGYYRKLDAGAFKNMMDSHEKEFQEAIENDTTGEGFIYQMFKYELANHEYGHTGELDDTLDALDLTIEKVKENKNLLSGLNKALSEF